MNERESGICKMETNDVPYCHGEKMAPTYRYLGGNGKIFITYRCMFCSRKEEVLAQ